MKSELFGLSPSYAISWVTFIGHLLSHCLNFVNRKMKMIENSCTHHQTFPYGVIIVKIKWTNTNTELAQFLAYGHHWKSVSYSYYHQHGDLCDWNVLSVSVLIFPMRAVLISITGSEHWLWKHGESTQLSQKRFLIFDPRPGLLTPHDMTSFSSICFS